MFNNVPEIPNELVEVVTKDGKLVLSVVVGNFIRWLYKRNIKFWVMALNVCSMIAVVKFISPAVTDYYGLGASGATAIGILAGLFGADIIRGLFRIGEIFANDPASLIPWRKK